MFSQLNMNMFDGYVNMADAKFYYNFWRPVTAIHEAATDGRVAGVWRCEQREGFGFHGVVRIPIGSKGTLEPTIPATG